MNEQFYIITNTFSCCKILILILRIINFKVNKGTYVSVLCRTLEYVTIIVVQQ